MTAAQALNAALIELADAGRRTPCQGRYRDNWTSDDPDERTEAARACLGCPIIELCSATAAESREHWHVWAATDRTPLSSYQRKRQGLVSA
jgi:hypothetical protein